MWEGHTQPSAEVFFLRDAGWNCPEASENFSVRRFCKNRRSRRDPIAYVDRWLPLRSKEHIDSGAEFDVPNTFTCGDDVSRLLVTYNPSRYQTCNLPANDPASRPFHHQRILLVLHRGFLMARHEELTFSVEDFRDSPRDGRPVYVNIKYVQENADPGFGRTELFYGYNFTVCRRHNGISAGSTAFRIPEEV